LVTGVADGTVNITYTDISGCDVTETITVNPLPTITGNAPICVGFTLQLTGSATPDGVTPWVSSNPGVATIDNTGLVTGVVVGTSTITYTNDNGCVITEDVSVINATITGILPVCVGGTLQLTGSDLPAVVLPWVSADVTIATIDNTGLVTGVSNGTVDITYTDINGCEVTETITVMAPTITGVLPVCIGETVQLSGSGLPAAVLPWVSADVTIATIDDAGLVTGVADGTVNITYTDINGCDVTEVITVNPDPVITTSQTALTVCYADDGILHVTDAFNATGTVTWTGTSSGVELNTTLQFDITGLAPGTYDVTFTDDITGCTSQSSQEIFINTGAPIIDELQDTLVCDSYILPTISGAVLSGNESYWSGTDGTGTEFLAGDVITQSGTFFIYDIIGTCPTEYSFDVTIVNSPVLDLINDVVSCESYTLPVITGSNLSGNASFYTDSQLNGGTILTGNITTTQTVWLYDTNGNMCSDEFSFEVVINPLPSLVNISGGGVYCDTEVINEVMVDVTGTPDWIINYTLDGIAQSITSTSSPVSLGTNGGVYVLTSVSDLNCSTMITGTQTVIINQTPAQLSANHDFDECVNLSTGNLFVEDNGGEYTWYSDMGLTDIIGTGSTLTLESEVGIETYYVTETLNDCEGDADEITVTINDCGITVPTAFSPNSDLINDDWEILGLDKIYPNNVVRVYNRWGNLLFESKPGLYDENRWNGMFKDKLLPIGSYFYIIEFNDSENGSMTGSVSIIL